MSINERHIMPVILCGGSGTRLWPLSRASFPKQFLVLSGQTTLFQQSIKRLQDLKTTTLNFNEMLIVANEDHRFLVLDQLRELQNVKAKLLLEPSGRNTAPALTFAAFQAIECGGDPVLIVTPADQFIEDQDSLASSLQNAVEMAIEGSIVVLGIPPSKPDTGFGYIQKDHQIGDHHTYKVLKFTEKPNLPTAENFIRAGNYFWNSGIFVLRASVWLEAIKYFDFDIYHSIKKAFNLKTKDDLFIRPNKDLFVATPSNSIDYAVIEKCPLSIFDIRMIELNAKWNDLGTWESVWQANSKDEHHNVSYGDSLLEGTRNSLVYANHKLVATLGIDNLIVIETSDAVLIANRNESQNIKKILDKLNSYNRKEQLSHRKVSRPWGWYDNLDEGKNFKVKRIQVNPGASLSLQKHSRRAEHWVVVKGVAEIICNDKKIILKENESTYIPLGHKHRLSNPGQDILQIIEIQSGDYLSEEDIERFDDNYGRV